MRTSAAALATVATLLLSACASGAGRSDSLPTIVANAPTVTIRDGEELRPDYWRLDPTLNPDVYEAWLPGGEPHRVTFITDVDSIGFTVAVGEQHDFVILRDGVPHRTRIVGTAGTRAAFFDDAYQRANRGRTRVDVPEVYELVNIAVALTPFAIEDPNHVYKESPYYADVRRHFAPQERHPVVLALDSILRARPGMYSTLKMNGYAFEFDANGRIVRSRVYDRTGFAQERVNNLLPYVDGLQDLADASGFRDFYRRHRAVYEGQIAFFRDTAELAAMRTWLERELPGRSEYDTYNIVFSPLVAYNQSVTWLSSNGFRELQPHINFPYPEDLERRAGLDGLSAEAAVLYRGNLAFTELNHGYINPEAERYAGEIARATSNRDRWVDPSMGPGYYGGIAAFNEHMNWVLVPLRYVDEAPAAERERMTRAVEEMMVRRGFPMFPELSRWLVGRYEGRGAGTTVADLYPEIIAWFAERNGG